MSATKYSSGTPGGEYQVIDAQVAANGDYQNAPGTAGGSGYDDGLLLGGKEVALPASQGSNAIVGVNGNVLIDSNNDYLLADPSISTVQGNPAQNIPTASALSQVVLNTQIVRLVFKNPA